MNVTEPVAARPQNMAGGPPPPPLTTERVEELLLTARPSAISCARMLVGSVSVLLELDSTTALALSDVVDELVAHSVATVGGNANGLALLGIRVRITETTLLIEVWDNGAEPVPELHDAPVLRRARWGHHRDRHDGRVIWCAIRRTPQREPTVRVPLPLRPERHALPPPVRPVEAMRDPVLLQRVLDGLRGLDRGKPVWPQQEEDS